MALEAGECGPIFPHENIDLFRANMDQSDPHVLYELRHFAGFLSMQALRILSPSARSWAFTVANGETGADIFPNKYEFGALVNELGYLAPQSVLVEPQGVQSGVDYREQVFALDDRSQRFCKPLNATRGRGTQPFDSSEDALAFAIGQGEPYLVQTLEEPECDWRYILHRDAVQLANDEAPGWRIAFQKVRPTVMGDGQRSIAELVDEHPQMPPHSKNGYIKHHSEALATVPTEGELVHLIHAGNVSQGAYVQMPSKLETANMDRFMAQFLHDVEEKLSTRLGTLCVDLGVKDAGVLTSEYDYDAIKQSVVFYEHQLPFGVLHDFPPDARWGKADRVAPWAFPDRYVEGQIYVNFIRSVIRSGRYLRSHAA
jgi:hypothetical protein